MPSLDHDHLEAERRARFMKPPLPAPWFRHQFRLAKLGETEAGCHLLGGRESGLPVRDGNARRKGRFVSHGILLQVPSLVGVRSFRARDSTQTSAGVVLLSVALIADAFLVRES